MGIDITKLDEDQLLEVLGDGKWHLTLPTDDPDLVILPEWRQEITAIACKWFVRWVITGIDIRITHDYDPPWDHSGSPQRYSVDPLILLTRHATLETWLIDEYNGQSIASYESGMGFYWQTYETQVRDKVEELVWELLKAHWLKFHHYPDDFELWEDPAWEDCSMVEICLSHALQLSIKQITTVDAWQQYDEIINTEISEEKYQAEIYREDYARMLHLVRNFWQQHFADLDGQTIEFPQFKAIKMGEKLIDILADTDPQIVEAIAKIGLPCIFSNKVKDTIQKIAQASLNAP